MKPILTISVIKKGDQYQADYEVIEELELTSDLFILQMDLLGPFLLSKLRSCLQSRRKSFKKENWTQIFTSNLNFIDKLGLLKETFLSVSIMDRIEWNLEFYNVKLSRQRFFLHYFSLYYIPQIQKSRDYCFVHWQPTEEEEKPSSSLDLVIVSQKYMHRHERGKLVMAMQEKSVRSSHWELNKMAGKKAQH